ncbi:Uncharacterized protein APZ42_005410 [Daphnia magna]|uniref:Uncharacterized protein n=2 Tax=Daphnia magna TaxID=35525 RepID=A0A164GGR5_9CRUS|nr:hypothetical protein OUZ56_027294 [Daphnia magna]KZR98938.1 Uncharacterized protein APZ42_005410 [Daphnia magna]
MVDINFRDEAVKVGESESTIECACASCVTRGISIAAMSSIKLRGGYNPSNQIYWRQFRALSPVHCKNPNKKTDVG